jgi:hypothetical protein
MSRRSFALFLSTRVQEGLDRSMSMSMSASRTASTVSATSYAARGGYTSIIVISIEAAVRLWIAVPVSVLV